MRNCISNWMAVIRKPSSLSYLEFSSTKIFCYGSENILISIFNVLAKHKSKRLLLATYSTTLASQHRHFSTRLKWSFLIWQFLWFFPCVKWNSWSLKFLLKKVTKLTIFRRHENISQCHFGGWEEINKTSFHNWRPPYSDQINRLLGKGNQIRNIDKVTN